MRQVPPEVVLEVAVDGVQRSSRHASGFALRFPRIVRVRHDKLPENADSIEAVEAIFASQVASGHREHGTRERKRDRTSVEGRSSRQLSLFGDDEQ
jgi:DNA ligase-1